MLLRAPRHKNSARGFTIIELLTVIAIIGILVAILIPTVTGANVSAKKARTKVQFSQWATAMEGFRQEYGYYPNFTLFTDGKIDTDLKTEQFVQTLTGKRLDGTALVAGNPGLLAGNTKRIAFCSFGPNEINGANLLQDAFGNTQIVVMMDRDQNGFVKPAGSGTGDNYSTILPPVGGHAPVLPTNGVRAGVIVYSPGIGGSVSDLVKSWE